MLYTVIAKPTKACNADCSYCSSPPDDAHAWTVADFKVIFDRISPRLSDQAVWIWHGGEPLLMGPDFYRECAAYVKASSRPNIKFSCQTNILLYKSSRWRDVFVDIFEGRVSTSFDPDEQNRTVKGSTEVYSRQFFRKLAEVQADGVNPLIIGTYTEHTASLMHDMYDRSIASPTPFHLRFNYRYPAGRAFGEGSTLTPETYGKNLIEMFDRWCHDLPEFMITPLDQMMKKVIGVDEKQCPWTSACGGRFIGIEPNGDVYNCGEFADLNNNAYRFGNLKTGTLSGGKTEQIVNFIRPSKSDKSFADEMMNTPGAKAMRRRVFDLPMDCKSCRHYQECEGGCMRDAELYGRGLGGKFFYCESWKMVFDHIKRKILSGHASNLLAKMGCDPETIQAYVRQEAEHHGSLERYL